jgi:hypothetical protein
MTQAQKTAKAKFKQAIAYRQKTGVSLKEAFAHIYGKKVGVSKKTNKKKIGALPIGFKGSIYDIGFKIVNQYDIYNDVSAIMEDTINGNRIVTFDGKGSSKDKAEAIVSYINKNTNIQGGYRDDKQLYTRMLKFATNMQKEVKDFNSGKKKTIKKEPFKIPVPKNTKMPIKKKVAKKVIRKKVAKKVVRKKVAKKKLSRIDYDKRYQAKKPGKRKSASGNTYYENRANRSDKGKLLGIGSVKNMTDKYIKTLNEIYQYNKAINIIQNDMTRLNYSPMEKQRAKQTIANFKKIVKELKIHSKELKKLI